MNLAAAFGQLAEQIHTQGLAILNAAREGLDDAGMRVSAPGESEPGEFYVETPEGISFTVRVEYLG